MKDNIKKQYNFLQDAINGNIAAIKGLLGQARVLTDLAETLKDNESTKDTATTIFTSVDKINDAAEKILEETKIFAEHSRKLVEEFFK